MSIHEHTIDRLKQIKVQPEVLADKKLVLLFVELERADRSVDFEQVESAISRMRRYLKRHNKDHLLIHGYQYVGFFLDGTRSKFASDKNGSGWCKLTFQYSRQVSREEHIIRQWAFLMYQRHAKFYVSRYRSARKSAMVRRSRNAKSQN